MSPFDNTGLSFGSASTKGGFNPNFGNNNFGAESDSLESFAREVLDKLMDENIPPVPSNFATYFEKILDEKPEEFKKKVYSSMELEQEDGGDKRLVIEKRIRESFINVREILKNVSTIYKNISLMSDIAKKRVKEIANVNNQLAVQNIVSSLNRDLDKLLAIIKNQSVTLKELYQQNAAIVKEVEEETIFDSQFGIYNKRYFLSQIEKEVKSIKQYNHQSTIILSKLSNSVLKSIDNQKTLMVMNRTVSKLLLKTSRRSDIVAYFQDGIFVMLLRHTDLFGAKKTSERVSELVKSTNFFIGDKEVTLNISIGIALLKVDRSVEENISCAMLALQSSDENPAKPFFVCKQDES